MYKRLKSPINTQIEITEDCTHSCQHCYNFWRNKDKCILNTEHKKLSLENISLIFQKLDKAEIFNIVITGGEPLLNFSVSLRCIELAHSYGMSVNMNSNLILIDKKKAENLKAAGLNHILTSILGPNADIHDGISQLPLSFEMLVKKIKIAQDSGIRISSNMVVSKLNYKYVIQTAEFVSKLGIKSFTATKAGCPGNCKDFSELALTKNQLIKYLNDLSWVRRNMGIKTDVLEPVPICGIYNAKHPEDYISRRCNAGVTTMTVSYDGTVRPCSHLDTSYGNLIEEDLFIIWSRMNNYSQGNQIPNDCKLCKIFQYCGSGCRAEAKFATNKLDGLDPYTNLEDIQNVSNILNKRVKKNDKQSELKKFKTTKFKIRKESFGGIIAIGNNKTVFLDHCGYKIMLQLNPDVIYDIQDMNIEWGGLDPKKFVHGLDLRKVVEFI